MNTAISDLLFKALNGVLGPSQIKQIADCGDFITEDDSYAIFHPDILRKEIYDRLSRGQDTKREAAILADQLVKELIPGMRELEYCVIDKWAVSLESDSCKGCPAYQWVVHRTGIHPCRLFMDITESKEGEWTGRPVKKCIRPQTVGAAYSIAREMNLPEPMVGKPDKKQYAAYCEEKLALCI